MTLAPGATGTSAEHGVRANRHNGVKGVAILGVTGSIGSSALSVLERHRSEFRLVAITAHRNASLLKEIEARWQPEYVGLAASRTGAEPGADRGTNPEWGPDAESLIEAATHPGVDIVINAVVGAAGLAATLEALKAGKRVALANKETLVLAGEIVLETARKYGGEVVPVDSEHSAILQCLAGRGGSADVSRLLLTASGGPFRTWDSEAIRGARPTDALRHPTWQMGNKITIDSATLANKALELIEAHHLFGVPYGKLDVVVHPQSIIHSFVEFVDGSVLAQMGVPSMELPILYALTWPERMSDSGVTRFDPVLVGQLTFEAVRHEDFPLLRLGLAAGKSGGAAPAVFNAANEEAVALFLGEGLEFPDIAAAVDAALQKFSELPGDSLEDLLIADGLARDFVLAGAGVRKVNYNIG